VQIVSGTINKGVSMKNFKIFTGNSNLTLANGIAGHIGCSLGNAEVGHFKDREIRVEIKENVRDSDIFIVQSTCYPANDNLMELMVMADALKRSSASRITAVIPYFGYARQDRRPRSARVPISAKVVANMLEGVGIDRILTVDLHSDQIQGFFDIPVDNIYATPICVSDIKARVTENVKVVSPDHGGVLRARAMAEHLNQDTELAIIDKRRPKDNVAQVMNVIGDVEGTNCIIVDDLVDTAQTLCKAAKALKDNGALSVRAYCTHSVLSGAAVDNITNSEIDQLVVTDTIPYQQSASILKTNGKLRVISTAKTLAQSIECIHKGKSVSSLFV
jgi:ribose-phosphate pyrophosphokinase